MDKTDHAILDLLKADARMSWQQIGQRVHLTGQAVSARVKQMEVAGVVSGFTVCQENLVRHLILVFMNSPQFDAFERFVMTEPCVEAAYKVTGEGCYELVFAAQDAAHSAVQLEPFLNRLLFYGTYRIHGVVRQIKSTRHVNLKKKPGEPSPATRRG